MNDTNKIWIIDDDDSIRWVLQKALEQAGMEVTSFNKADGILDRLQHSEPDTTRANQGSGQCGRC